MHDFILAKQILDEINRVAKEKGIGKIKSVELEIGSVALAHINIPDHTDEIDPGNLKFILENMAPKYGLDKAAFNIKKVPGESWKILNIEVE